MEQLKRLQFIEREMISEGKSPSEIDAAKASLREQSFSGIPPELSGVASLSETALNMSRGPRGIAAYMQDGGEAEGYAAEGKKFADDFGPVRNVTAKDAVKFVAEMTPILGDVMAAKDLWSEATSENPNWGYVTALGGATAIGLIPGAGPLLAKGLKAGAKNVFNVGKNISENMPRYDPNVLGSMGGNLFSKRTKPLPSGKNYFELVVLGDNKKLKDIAAEFGVTSENLADANFDTLRSILNRAEKRGVMDPRDAFSAKKNLAADEIAMNKEMFSEGGAVMQGVGSLNETARNMSRGPRGIAGYQQFAEGGELNVNLRPLDLPVDGRMSYTQTDDGGRFDSEIRKTFEGGLGSLTPSFDYSTQNSSRNRGDLVIDENGEQIGFALEGELFLKPQSEDKVRGAFAIEKSRNNTDFTFPEGEFVETREGLLKRFNLGMDLGNFGIDLNRTEASGREPINEGSATIRIGENGIVRYSDSDRGEPNIEFNYSKQFADGGPVYMKKGGEGKEESARQKILNTIYGVESNNNYDAWNTSAKNPPQKDLTSLTVKEIMDYQGNNKGPAAGAGQIKFDTLSYLINAGTLSEDDLFTAATQDIANNKLLDRRGFNSWLSGDLSDLDFGDNIASEWASIPLLSSMTTPNGVEKERGESRYGGSNKALLGADVWENVLYTAKGQSKTPQTIDEIVLAEAYTPEKLVSEVMAGSPTYMTDESSPLSMVERYPQSGPLGRVESYPQSGPLGRVESYPVDRVESYPVDRVERYPVDRVERYPDMQEVGTPQESLYEKYSPQVVQDALLGIGYLNSVSGPSATNQ